jgi:hypothetical protein
VSLIEAVTIFADEKEWLEYERLREKYIPADLPPDDLPPAPINWNPSPLNYDPGP